jgi:transcription initiation factor IIF auxiliary subunit
MTNGNKGIRYPVKITITNTSKYDYSDHETDWFYWTIIIETDPEEFLQYIKSVRYHLHPTFPQKEITISDRHTNFKLESRGWGEFIIKLDIILKDNKKATVTHYLALGGSSKEEVLETKTERVLLEKDFTRLHF